MAQAMYLIQNGQADTFEIGEDGTVTAYKYETVDKVDDVKYKQYMRDHGYGFDEKSGKYFQLSADGQSFETTGEGNNKEKIEADQTLLDAAHKFATTVKIKVELTGDKANVTGSTVDSGQAAVEDLKKTARDSAASLADMSAEEFDDYTARLYEILDTTGKAFSALDETETQAFYNLTTKIKLAEDGFSALQATSKDTWKILNKQTKYQQVSIVKLYPQ